VFRRPDRIIVPQYSAPTGLSLLAAAELLGAGQRAISAQIVDLAVRRALAIAPLDPGRSKKSGFALTLRSLDGLGADELETMQALFPRGVVGESIDIRPGRNAALGRRLRLPHGHAVARLVRSGSARERGWFERTFSRGRAVPIVPLPPSNATVDHLWGIRDYIALAEKDRLAFLQSPRGALLRGDGGADGRTGVDALLLNEKLLPYAVLFGLEREWVRELGVQYEAIGSTDPAALQLLGDIAFLYVDADGLEALMVLGDLAETLVGVGRIVGGVGLFLLDIAS
jgi:hypothetical protein